MLTGTTNTSAPPVRFSAPVQIFWLLVSDSSLYCDERTDSATQGHVLKSKSASIGSRSVSSHQWELQVSVIRIARIFICQHHIRSIRSPKRSTCLIASTSGSPRNCLGPKVSVTYRPAADDQRVARSPPPAQPPQYVLALPKLVLCGQQPERYSLW